MEKKRIGRLPNDGRDYKLCVECNEEKPISDFPQTMNTGYKRYRNRCRPCYRAYCLRLPKRSTKKEYPDNQECKKCGEIKPISEFYTSSKQGFVRSSCKKCYDRQTADYRKERREFFRARERMEYYELRLFVLEKYGNQCVCCGESHEQFLAFDHVNGDGAAHRKEIGGTTHDILKWILVNDYPDTIQILCWNCNWAKSHGGCPHQESIVDSDD